MEQKCFVRFEYRDNRSEAEKFQDTTVLTGLATVVKFSMKLAFRVDGTE